MVDFIESDNAWIDLLILGGAILLALLTHFLLFYFLRKSSILKSRIKLETICKELNSPIRILLILVFIFIVYPSLTALSLVVSSTIKHILNILFIFTLAWLSIKGVRAGRLILMRKYDLSIEDNLKARKAYTQVSMIENILNFIIIIISVGVALMTFEGVRQVGVSLLTSAGIAGIILGFAAQKLIATILAGIQLALTQPIRIDDVVVVEGEWGRIEELNLTFVVVKIWDERRLVLPTTYFIENPFQNWTRTSSQILGTVYIYTDYRVPLDEIRAELTRLLEASPIWDKRVNVVQVTDVKETTIEIRALISAEDSGEAWNLRVYIREKLLEFLRDNYPDSLPHSRIILKNPFSDENADKEN